MRLTELTETMESLEQTNSRNEKKSIIRQLFNDLNQNNIRIVSGILTNEHYDSIGLGKRSIKSVLELNFDDYSEVSYAVKSEYESEQETLQQTSTLLEIDGILKELSRLSGNEQKNYFADVMNRVEVSHILTQAILNDMDLGVSSKTLTNALTDDMSDIRRERLNGLYPTTNRLVSQLRASETDVSPTVGEAFKPMLAKPNGEQKDGLVYEPKIDGYRLIIHHNENEDNNETKAYSRRLNDVTESLPELQDIDLPTGIYDCEVIAEDGTYKSTSERIGSKDVQNPEQKMEFVLFDVISMEGEDVSRKSLDERRDILELCKFDRENNVCRIINQYDYYTKAKDYAMNNELEGVMCKNPESKYIFGKRSGNWKKIKYTDETADVRIVGMEEGNGKLKDSLGKVELETKDGISVGWCGTGFTEAERKKVWNNRDVYYNKIIEVTYEDYDDGLRFPRFERFRPTGEPDTEEKIIEMLE